MKISTDWLGLLMALFVSCVEAESHRITAKFTPDSTKPQNNVFINTTPNTGFCAMNLNFCTERTSSLQITTTFQRSEPFQEGALFDIKAPSGFRKIHLRNMQTGGVAEVEIRINGIGSMYSLPAAVDVIVGQPINSANHGHQLLWDSGAWATAGQPCAGMSGAPWFNAPYHNYIFVWGVPLTNSTDSTACTKKLKFPISGIFFSTWSFSYELKTPNPLGMDNGIYTGSLIYSLGPDGDFDFAGTFPDDDALGLDFVLEVQHTLKVEIPPGGNKVSLEPAGGWQSWIEQGRKPTRIFRDLSFFISASSGFKVNVQCQFPSDHGGCGLRDSSGAVASVDVLLSLPNGLTFSNAPVRRAPLNHSLWSGPFRPERHIDKQVGTLHFEIRPSEVTQLLLSGVGASTMYRGSISVVWDSEI